MLQPTNTSVPVGQTATFTAAAVGYLPITYQWLKNGTPVPNETNSTYSFSTVLGDNNSTDPGLRHEHHRRDDLRHEQHDGHAHRLCSADGRVAGFRRWRRQ